MRLKSALCLALAFTVVVGDARVVLDDKTIHEVDPAVLAGLFKKWHWEYRGASGGSTPGWLVPGSYKGCEFGVQGGEGPTSTFKIRIQRHPQLTDDQVAWATEQQKANPGLTIFAEKSFGFEISFPFDLGDGIPESKFKKQLSKLLDKSLPIVKHLNSGKYNW